jgi:hypothetical protein
MMMMYKKKKILVKKKVLMKKNERKRRGDEIIHFANTPPRRAKTLYIHYASLDLSAASTTFFLIISVNASSGVVATPLRYILYIGFTGRHGAV